MITIPSQQNKKWIQLNSGDVFGNIYKSKNLDFSSEGYLSLSKKVRAFHRDLASGGDFDQLLAIAFLGDGTGALAFTNDDIFDFSLSGDALTLNTDSGDYSPSFNGDAVSWNGRIYGTSETTTKYWDGSLWTSVGAMSVTTGTPHPLCVFESFGYLAIARTSNTVGLYNSSHTLIVTLTIPEEQEIQWMWYRDQQLYIGTRNTVGKEGRMYVWNGSGTAAQRSYGVKAECSMSGCEYQNSIATVTSRGQVLLFNGGGFDILANFPVYYTPYRWTDDGKVMQRRGMISDGSLLYMNIEGQVQYNNTVLFLDTQPSGLWVYDSDNGGLYHKGGASSDAPIANYATDVDTATDIVTLSVAVETQTGEPIVWTGAFTAGGITLDKAYYAIRLSSTTFQFAETYDDAIAGTYIDITSEPGVYGSTVTSVLFPKGGDFGQVWYSSTEAGAVALIPESEISRDFVVSEVIYGIRRVSEDLAEGTNYSTLLSFTLGENRGYMETTKFFSSALEDIFTKVFIKVRGLFNDNDKAIVKYKISEKQFYPLCSQMQGYSDGVIWTDTSTFTTTNPYFQFVEVGEEVEVITGAGAGFIGHITSITSDTGTFTVILDETIPLISANDTSHVLVNNYKKLGEITSADTSGHQEFSLPEEANSAKWLQIKVELRGSGVQLEELQIPNNIHLPTK